MTERDQSAYSSRMFRIEVMLCRVALRCVPTRFNKCVTMNRLADLFYVRFERLGAISDLDDALALYRDALELCPHSHSLWVWLLGSTGSCLHARFTRAGALSDLEEAITLRRNVLELRPQGYPHRPRAVSLGDLASSLHVRFISLGTLSDLEEALALERSALDLRPQGHPDRAYSLGKTAGCLYSRFMQLGTLSDLGEALTLQRSALELRPQGHPERAQSLSSVAECLHLRFTQLGTVSDLEEALVLERSALELLPQGHPDRTRSLGNIASCFYLRFTQLGTLSDLEEGLALQRIALELLPRDHPERARSLSNIASCLYFRFTQLGTLSDLEEAIDLQRGALELCPQGHPRRALLLSNITAYFHSRFTQLGTLSDLEEAIAIERSALALRQQGHPDRAYSLGNIAGYLYSRFIELGALSDLEEALALQRNALELRPQGHPERAHSLCDIAVCLYLRFTQLGTLSDLEEALTLQRSALELRLQGHPERARSLSNIASCLRSRFKQLGTLSDLEEALTLERDALELCPQGNPRRAQSLSSIAECLHLRFTHLGTLSDLEEALALERSALELRPQGHPNRTHSLANVASYFYSRFTRLGTLSDLEEALAFERSSLALRPQGDPSRASSLGSLAQYFRARFKHSTMHDMSDLQESFNLYSHLSDISQTVSHADLGCAKQWIQAAEEFEHSTTVLAYQTFLRFSVHHFATLPSLPQHLALFKQLTTSVAADAFSACVRYGNYANAIELLEQGRGIFWSQLIRLRSPLDDLIASGDAGKKLADKFMHLSFLLRNVLDAPPNDESQHDRGFSLNTQLQNVVADIRNLPGFSHFLQPPLFSDLQTAAAGGPVIIVNASQYSCDALVLLPDRDPMHVALDVTKARVSELSSELRSLTLRAKSRDVTRDLLAFLRELWDVIVFPVVTILREFCPRGSRIWWCPTAEFSLLPLHAAGSFRKGESKLTDLYISSYTPTLTALIRARQKKSSMDQPHFLVVGQAQAPGQNELVSVNTELSNVSQHVSSVATVTCIRDQDANIAKVAEELNKNNFVHFACHGIPDRKRPFESGFALGDGRLNIEHIMRYNLQDAMFAYLSACHTTVGDEESPDEVIHLAAAMQFAGFPSVIGTMWAVDDAHTQEITSTFYENLIDESGRLDHTRAALALYRTMRRVGSNTPLDQRILYIHIGA